MKKYIGGLVKGKDSVLFNYFIKLQEIIDYYLYISNCVNLNEVIGATLKEEIQSRKNFLGEYKTDLKQLTPFEEKILESYKATNLPGMFKKDISQLHLVLRQQSIVTAYSLFESFLTDFVKELYLLNPKYLGGLGKKVSYHDIIQNKNKIIDYLIEKELQTFRSLRGIEKKVEYLMDTFNLNKLEESWVALLDISKDSILITIKDLRNSIVHDKESPDLPHEGFFAAYGYLLQIVFSIAHYISHYSHDSTA